MGDLHAFGETLGGIGYIESPGRALWGPDDVKCFVLQVSKIARRLDPSSPSPTHPLPLTFEEAALWLDELDRWAISAERKLSQQRGGDELTPARAFPREERRHDSAEEGHPYRHIPKGVSPRLFTY